MPFIAIRQRSNTFYYCSVRLAFKRIFFVLGKNIYKRTFGLRFKNWKNKFYK